MRFFKNKIFLIVAALVVLVVLFMVLKPNSSTIKSSDGVNGFPHAALIHNFNLKITGNQVTGDTSMNVDQGDNLVIYLSSDADHEVHLHGYDKEVQLKAGTPSKLTLTANQTGRFIIELHPSEQEIAVLQVQPR